MARPIPAPRSPKNTPVRPENATYTDPRTLHIYERILPALSQLPGAKIPKAVFSCASREESLKIVDQTRNLPGDFTYKFNCTGNEVIIKFRTDSLSLFAFGLLLERLYTDKLILEPETIYSLRGPQGLLLKVVEITEGSSFIWFSRYADTEAETQGITNCSIPLLEEAPELYDRYLDQERALHENNPPAERTRATNIHRLLVDLADSFVTHLSRSS